MQCENLSEAVNGLQESNREIGGKWLTFWLEGQSFGVSIAGVEQIVSMQPIVEVPEYPACAKGIINLRGSIIPVVDLRRRLGKPEKAYTDHTCIIINRVGNEQLGFIVDEVDSVIDISGKDISPPPKIGEDTTNRYLTGIAHITDSDDAKKIILCLDAELVLRKEELNAPQGGL